MYLELKYTYLCQDTCQGIQEYGSYSEQVILLTLPIEGIQDGTVPQRV